MELLMMMLNAPISPELQQALQIIAPALMILMALFSIALIVIVLVQSGNTSDITAMSGGNASNAYLGKNKNEDKNSRLKMWTYILGAAMLLNSIAFYVLQFIGKQS